MGCDGGTIPKRDELVRTKKKAEQKDKVSERSFLWGCCNISQRPLEEPIVACGLGRLYNKEAVIMGIIDVDSMPDSINHIKSLRDVRELKMTRNPVFESGIEKGDQYVDHQSSKYICPVIGLEMNGKFKFCFSWDCGCVVSERAMKQIKSNLCHKCQEPIVPENIVILNATGDDLDQMKTRMEERQARLKAERKSKKGKKVKVKQETEEDEIEPKPGPSSLQNGSASVNNIEKEKLQNKLVPVKAEKMPEKRGLKRPANSLVMEADDFKKTKTSYSIAKDPKASNVYKSLFTSSSEAQNQMKAHWITYNPFYN